MGFLMSGFLTPAFLSAAVLALAALPALLTIWNHLVFRTPPVPDWERDSEVPKVSILIPARNEEKNIRRAVQSALRNKRITAEVFVLDDHSTDSTGQIVRDLSAKDSRVRLIKGSELPPGWCGKQHACRQLAAAARYDLLFFVDADVKLSRFAAARLAGFLRDREADLVSAFPRQETGTFLEKLLIPLIEFVLLGYLPIQMGRIFRLPGFGAGCGQIFLARKAAYEKSGGHSAIRASMHDGVKLPRAFRKAGFRTDVCAGHRWIGCRMYRGAKEVWNGLLKNAHEGVAHPAAILPFTVLLLGGAVAPFFLFPFRSWFGDASWMISCAAALAWLPRLLNAARFGQSLTGCLLHPVSVLLFVIIQWQSLARILCGRKPEWKGRVVE